MKKYSFTGFWGISYYLPYMCPLYYPMKITYENWLCDVKTLESTIIRNTTSRYTKDSANHTKANTPHTITSKDPRTARYTDWPVQIGQRISKVCWFLSDLRSGIFWYYFGSVRSDSRFQFFDCPVRSYLSWSEDRIPSWPKIFSTGLSKSDFLDSFGPCPSSIFEKKNWSLSEFVRDFGTDRGSLITSVSSNVIPASNYQKPSMTAISVIMIWRKGNT